MGRWAVGLMAVVAAGLGVCWVLAAGGGGFKSFNGEAFGTSYRVVYRGSASVDAVREAVEGELSRIDALASTWREDSELMRYNRAAEPGAFELSAELSGLIARAEGFEASTGGAFSPRPRGEGVDLSAIAKGYAVDRVVGLLSSLGIGDAMVEIGGEIAAAGDGPGGKGWRVGVYVPSEAGGVEPMVIALRDRAVATSGQTFSPGHVVDPSDGEPVEGGVLSATVVDGRCETADALATALFVMGPERGLVWAEARGVWVVYLLADGRRLEHRPSGGLR
ncbi:MAG: FAD:protein FMN transferase [Phycisphaeraceae bacterium]